MKNIVVLVSGNGSTLQALIDACAQGRIAAKIVSVVSNKAEAYGLERAKQAGIPRHVFLRKHFENNGAMDQSIGDYIEAQGADLIVLAGYMKILSPEFTRRFSGKILNIHPSLLPKYPGLHTYQRAMEAGNQEHGTTVHFVNEEVDGGTIVLQAKVPIFPDDELADVEERTREQERRIYPLVVNWFVQGRLRLENQRAYLDNQLLPPQGYAAEE